jgi:hypothetical protein
MLLRSLLRISLAAVIAAIGCNRQTPTSAAAPATPEQPASKTYTDRLLTTPATPEVVAKGLEADGYQLGLSAYS